MTVRMAAGEQDLAHDCLAHINVARKSHITTPIKDMVAPQPQPLAQTGTRVVLAFLYQPRELTPRPPDDARVGVRRQAFSEVTQQKQPFMVPHVVCSPQHVSDMDD